jgi:hypothetical protein
MMRCAEGTSPRATGSAPERRGSRKPGKKPQDSSTEQHPVATQPIQADPSERPQMTTAALGIRCGRLHLIPPRAAPILQGHLDPNDAPHHYRARTAFAMEMPAICDTDGIVMFSDDGTAVEDLLELRFWKSGACETRARIQRNSTESTS